MLQVEKVCSGYGQIEILTDVSLKITSGSIVSLIGSNGAGKSTLLRTLSSLIRCRSGKINFEGYDITQAPPHKVVELGIIQVPEGRQIIGELSVRENITLGCYIRYHKLGSSGRKRLLDSVNELFPVLRERMNQVAGTLSGGEQQMLAIARALMGEPKLMLLDEPSLGLAPLVVNELLNVLLTLNSKGLSLFLVEQNTLIALEKAQWTYVLEGGKIVLEGTSQELLNNDKVRKIYLGIND